MSPPDTNIEIQKRRHRGPLLGIGAAVILVIIGFVWWLGGEFGAQSPAEPATPSPAPVSEIEPETETLPATPEAPAPETPGTTTTP
ncbi:hypothetical protein [Pseudogemmobacter sonorensis]|uniref:hypothetical protein n=1 Tax=Pseudogemmobacter sonorensis TaxID=2989681 RepID=UPI0036C7BDF2